MRVMHLIREVKEFVSEQKKAGRTIGLVPTMGYLHEGHLALINEARKACDVVVVTIFVNPLQFGPSEDFERYPRDPDRDAALCLGAGVDLIFAPPVEEMYPRPTWTFVEVQKLTKGLCGASRPGHFRGVATVVTKLFNIVQPDRAFFGQKDAQQVTIIKRMAGDLNLNLAIVTVPTVREPDGLAMSSRNAYLSPEERRAAAALYRSLRLAEELIRCGERDAGAITERMRALIDREPLARIDYVSIVDGETLEPLSALSGRVLIALAVFIGRTRLIDNYYLEVSSDNVAHFL